MISAEETLFICPSALEKRKAKVSPKRMPIRLVLSQYEHFFFSQITVKMNDLSILVSIGIIPACCYVLFHKQVIAFERYFKFDISLKF
jgi:hypothetical protein